MMVMTSTRVNFTFDTIVAHFVQEVSSSPSFSRLRVFFLFGFPPAILPFRFSFRSSPFLPHLGRCLAIAPPRPLASSPEATRLRQAEWPPIKDATNVGRRMHSPLLTTSSHSNLCASSLCQRVPGTSSFVFVLV